MGQVIMTAAQNHKAKGLKKFVKIAIAGTALIIAIPGILITLCWYVNWAAERDARAFCDEIELGEDISIAIKKAGLKKILDGKWADPPNHTFYFPGMIFDKAVCEVSVNNKGRVVSKASQMEWD
jgi:hypothetical protein